MIDSKAGAARRVGGALVVALLTCASVADAQSDRSWEASVEVGTDFPLSVGARGRLDVASHYRFALGVGFLPGAYVDAINGFVVGMGWYDEATATLIKSALKSSLVVAPSAGVRPWALLGLYFEAGYRWISLGGQATGGELISGLTGQAVPEARDGRARTFSARSTLHMLSAEVGWEWPLERHWQLRAALGGAFTLASSTTIEPDYQARAPRVVDSFTALGADELDELETSYVHTPYVAVSAGYRF